MVGNVPISLVTTARRRPLAACVASVFALAAPISAIADSWTITSCDQGSSGNSVAKTGTLRFALSNATSPAILDLTGLTACSNSKISLTTGELETTIATLTLLGPGSNVLAVDASGLPPSYGDRRVLKHAGGGKLTIQDLGVSGGHIYHSTYSVYGGCIASSGDVELDNVSVSTCYAKAKGGFYPALGGGIFAVGTVTLNNATVTESFARSLDGTSSKGGGIYAGGSIAMNNFSLVSSSYAKANAGAALGGGLYTQGNLTITNGTLSTNSTYSGSARAKGGGAYVKGNGGMVQSWLKYNTTKSGSYRSYGGGAYIAGNFTFTNSTAYKNDVTSYNPFSVAEGGGVKVVGNFFTSYSTIRDNTAHGYSSFGGGLNLDGDVVTISASTISGNTAEGGYAGVDVVTGHKPGTTFQISSSTISGNKSSGSSGGLYVDSANAKFYNTTIAFNSSVGAHSSPGVRLRTQSPSTAVTMESTLLSNNTYGNFENDFEITSANPAVFNSGNLATPANNLIRVTFVSPSVLPADTKQGFCPQLGQLRDNGGLTKTHALLSHSIALDAGNNFFSLSYDQRGPAAVNGIVDYPRVLGPVGNPIPKADIGAYEVNQADVVFDTDFEGCVPLPV